MVLPQHFFWEIVILMNFHSMPYTHNEAECSARAAQTTASMTQDKSHGGHVIMLSWLQDAIDIIFMQIVSRKDEIDRIFRQIASFRPHKSCKIDEKLIKWCVLRHIPLYLLTQGLDLQHLDHFSASFRHAEHDEHGFDDWFWVKIGRFYD